MALLPVSLLPLGTLCVRAECDALDDAATALSAELATTVGYATPEKITAACVAYRSTGGIACIVSCPDDAQTYVRVRVRAEQTTPTLTLGLGLGLWLGLGEGLWLGLGLGYGWE